MSGAWTTAALVIAVISGATSCSESVKRTLSIVRIVPEGDSQCGAPPDARSMLVRAIGDFQAGETTAQSIELGQDGRFVIDRFGADTKALEVEVRGFGGAVVAIGRSAEFSIEELEDGASIPVFMAPPNGLCATGIGADARRRPLLARLGAGVLVAGGVDESGLSVASVQWYDSASSSVENVDVSLYGDLNGATMTTLGDGRVLVIGGTSTGYQLVDPNTREFSAPAFYREARSHHVATALPDGRVFLAAGCSQPLGEGCVEGTALLTSTIIEPDTGELVPGPLLTQRRVGGLAWWEGLDSILLVGGTDAEGEPVAGAERVFLDGRTSVVVPDVSGASAQTDEGVVWAGLQGVSGEPASELWTVVPDAEVTTGAGTAAFADKDVAMLALEDGSLLAFGRQGAQQIQALDGETTDLRLPELSGRVQQRGIRLGDGAVLILGGDEGGAFVYRPSLAGPLSGAASATFESEAQRAGLTSGSPGAIEYDSERGSHIRMERGEAALDWVLFAGPVLSDMSFEAAATSDGTIALLFGWLSPSSHWRVELEPGKSTRLVRLEAGVESLSDCAGQQIPAGALSEVPGANATHQLGLRVRSAAIEALLDGEVVLSCTVDEAPTPGKAGLGALGSIGQPLRVDLLSVGRR